MRTNSISPHTIRAFKKGKSCWIGLLLWIAAGMVFGSLPAGADAVTDKSDHFIARKHESPNKPEFVNVIVRMVGPWQDDMESKFAALEGKIYCRLPLINAVALRIPGRQLKALAEMPFIARLSEDVITRRNDAFTIGSSGADIAFQSYGVTGGGVTIAVLDSGIKQRPDLNGQSGSSRVLAHVNFVPNESNAEDACGHGTHVAGIIAGNGSSSTGNNCYRTFWGIARSANLVNVRVLNSQGAGSVSTVIQGIQWCLQNRAAYNIRVMNLSLGHLPGESYTTDPLCQAVEQAWKAGIVVVCAAGNDGRLNTTHTPGLDNEGWGTAYNTINVPGNDPYVITVGGMKSVDGNRINDAVSTYSSRGPTAGDNLLKPDIVAPGNRVISLRCPNSTVDILYGSTNTVPLNYYLNSASTSDTPQYFSLSGTSMAAPVVSGAVALMLQASPGLSPDTVKARLMISADKVGFSNGLNDPCTFGAGYLNIPAALNCGVIAGQPALSPVLLRDSTDTVYLDQFAWENKIIWGTDINNLAIIWGTKIIWGTNTLLNSNMSWGVQGTKIIWGTNSPWAQGPIDSTNMCSVFGED